MFIIVTLFLLLGDIFLCLLPTIIDKKILVAIVAFCLIGSIRFKCLRLVCSFFLGLLLANWSATCILIYTLPKQLEKKPIMLSGIVSDIVTQNAYQTTILLAQSKIEVNKNTISLGSIKLSYISKDDKPPHLFIGDVLSMTAKLKRVHAPQNPGGFDAEKAAFENSIRAQGYIQPGTLQLRNHHYWFRPWMQLRNVFAQKINRLLPNYPEAKWLPALLIGERKNVPQQDWNILRKTGSNHLMAIAGLHLGILFSFSYLFFNFFWRFFPRLLLHWPAQKFATLMGFIMVLLYAAISGLALPTIRAVLMLALHTFCKLNDLSISFMSIWSISLAFVIFLWPLSILNPSFWLSFCTLGFIIYGMHYRIAARGLWWKWGRVQWIIGICILPLTLFFFQEASITSLIVNSITIPFLAILILPLCFLIDLILFLHTPLAKLLIKIVSFNLFVLWKILGFFATLPIASFHKSLDVFALITLSIAILFLILPKNFPGKWLGLIWLIPTLTQSPNKPQNNSFWVSLIDVGQGLSVFVETKNHSLLFDTGVKYFETDMGEKVIIPYLRAQNISAIDKLIISHGDNDHSGGALSLLKTIKIKSLDTSVPEKFAHYAANYCLQGTNWTWDGIQFSYLFPDKPHLHLGNNSSCVLKITNGKNTVLLPGDIEKKAEKKILQDYKESIKSTVLIAPHHGSKTSGLISFINATRPTYVLFPIGYLNRYHFPHPSVIKSYKIIGSKLFDSATCGHIQFKFNDTEAFNRNPSCYRLEHHRIWWD